MFFSKIAAGGLLVGIAQAGPVDKTIGEQKRYSQLIEQMEHFNPQFDERNYWTYGCNCLMLGDRPMSDPGKGAPVDALDSVCKRYKDCVKCASMTYGDQCIGEFVKYKVNMNNGPTCKDNAGTCERALCECDKLFAEEHVGAIHVYNDDFHRFYSTTGFDADTDCLKGSGGIVIPECCGADDGPQFIYNAHNKQCCPDGSIKPSSQSC
jgi:hypothetical protein